MKINDIETPRLLLRGFTKEDALWAYSIWNNPEMGQYLTDEAKEEIDDEYLKMLEGLGEDEECCYLIPVFKDSLERVGTCSFMVSDDKKVYDIVIKAGTFPVSTIKTAEAVKVVENSQRDINIAFMNELAKIFNAMNIDTHDVIEAASTKWNFIKLSPGLVGGHCISVDPYYLIQKAQVYGVLPRIMSAARRLNDGMGAYVANQTIKCMNKKGVLVKDAKILILGITFKENCPDLRNSKILDIYTTLHEYTNSISVYDPWANSVAVKKEYGIDIIDTVPTEKFDAIILAVAHKQFINLDVKNLLNPNGVIYDVKGVLPRNIVDGRL